jgi:prophage regulatory protein
MSSKILRLRDVQSWTGLSRSSIYLMMRDGGFPKSLSLGTRSVGWLEADIQGWIDSRVSSSNNKGEA